MHLQPETDASALCAAFAFPVLFIAANEKN